MATSAQALITNATQNISDVTSQGSDDVDAYSYANVAFLFGCFCVGVPLNILVLYRLVRRIRKMTPVTRATLLKLNLNASDIFVFAFFVVPRWVWKLTYFWYDSMIRFD